MYVRAALHCGSSNLGGLLDVPAEKYQFIFLRSTVREKHCRSLLSLTTDFKNKAKVMK